MKQIKIITEVPEGYKWTGTTRLSKFRIENVFVPIHRNCDCKYCK